MICSSYGERVENTRKRRRIEFVTSYEKCGREQSKFIFRGSRKVETNSDDPLIVFENDKRELTFDKLTYPGFSVSEIPKLHLYEFLMINYNHNNLKLT